LGTKRLGPLVTYTPDPQLGKADALPTELVEHLVADEIAILLKFGKVRWGSVSIKKVSNSSFEKKIN
jgi:hypothetical protein